MQKTSITQVPLANDRLVRDTALQTKTETREVLRMVKFVGKFVANTIERGKMEGVMLPYFGKFKPKSNIRIQQMTNARQRNGMQMIYQAITGREVRDLRNKLNYDKPRSAKSVK